jgi:hypothetical protein
MQPPGNHRGRALDVVAGDRQGCHRRIVEPGAAPVADNARVPARPSELPIRLALRDESLRRSRLTVFLRALLALPHLVWLGLWGIAVSFAAIALWLGVVIEGKAPESIHGFVAGYLRYATHVAAYLFLAADPFPGFRGAPGYPVDLEVDPPARQSRWSGLFRLVLALPAALLASALGGGLAWTALAGPYVLAAILLTGGGVAGSAAFLAWFAALVTGRAPRGLRDLIAYALGYSASRAGTRSCSRAGTRRATRPRQSRSPRSPSTPSGSRCPTVSGGRGSSSSSACCS